jgi:hypothetical protein
MHLIRNCLLKQLEKVADTQRKIDLFSTLCVKPKVCPHLVIHFALNKEEGIQTLSAVE